jgi:hypothetical protein
MPTDLTERLAAKLEGETESTGETDWLLLYRVDSWLPLLLSEPELVAGLPEEVRLSVLTPRERAVMRVGECAIVLDQSNFDTVGEAGMRHNGAIAKYHALAPEVDNGK